MKTEKAKMDIKNENLEIDPRKYEWDPAFRMERSESKSGCGHCGSEVELWDVVGPDGVALGTSYAKDDDAQQMADELSRAFLLGWQACENDAAAIPK